MEALWGKPADGHCLEPGSADRYEQGSFFFVWSQSVLALYVEIVH